jgi:hypothetical protein
MTGVLASVILLFAIGGAISAVYVLLTLRSTLQDGPDARARRTPRHAKAGLRWSKRPRPMR